MKIAVALAVLRCKPPGITGQEYAQQLCSRISHSQMQWKEKLQQAQSEILHLKQQLVMISRDQKDASQNRNESFSGSQSLYPTPPPSGGDNIEIDFEETPDKSNQFYGLAKNTAFLQHIINLQTVSNVLPLDNNLKGLTKSTLMQSLDLLPVTVEMKRCSINMQLQCITCILTVLNKVDEDTERKVLQKMSSVCENISQQIVSDQESSRTIQEQRAQLLCEFSKNHKFLPILLINLCTKIDVLSQYLREVVNKQSTLDAAKFNNMYYVLNVIDKSMGLKTVLTDDVLISLKLKLENCLLHLTEKFPLFAHGVWRIIQHLC